MYNCPEFKLFPEWSLPSNMRLIGIIDCESKPSGGGVCKISCRLQNSQLVMIL